MKFSNEVQAAKEAIKRGIIAGQTCRLRGLRYDNAQIVQDGHNPRLTQASRRRAGLGRRPKFKIDRLIAPARLMEPIQLPDVAIMPSAVRRRHNSSR
jgi:hypothetical protein